MAGTEGPEELASGGKSTPGIALSGDISGLLVVYGCRVSSL